MSAPQLVSPQAVLQRTALLVDAPGEASSRLVAALESGGFRCEQVSSSEAALTRLGEGAVALIVCAEELASASEVLAQVRAAGSLTSLLAARDDAGVRAGWLDAGADDVLVRPIDAVELLARARRRLAQVDAISAARAESLRLHQLAVSDGLTGLANYRFFQDRLREEFRRAQRYDSALGLVMMDLDHFKVVNDTFGHQVGDEVLVAAAQAIKHAVRETDVVARCGGEEFAMLLPQTHLAGALTVAERVAASLKRLTLSVEGLRVSASFGLSGFPVRGVNSAEQLLRAADEALYRAKRDGRDRISLFQPGASAPAAH